MKKLQETAIDRAIRIAGGPKEVARKLKIKRVWSVYKWQHRQQIPPQRIIPLEKLTNGEVTRHELDPELYPDSN